MPTENNQFRFILLVAAFFLCFSNICFAQKLERKEVSSLTAQELESFRRGVEKMKMRNASPRGSVDYLRSWEFWSNNHGHFGSDCPQVGPLDNNVPGMKDQLEVAAMSEIERNAWCACRHDSVHFLAWHRVYLYFFERVLREASGDPSLTLPYWDYGVKGNNRFPKAFSEKTYTQIDSGKTVENPLYQENRNSRLHNGGEINSIYTNYDTALAATKFSDPRNGTGLTELIDQQPHGTMHCYSAVNGNCPNGLMGSFATAAKDPIFWLHHANIDRLVECWRHQGDSKNDFDKVAALMNSVYGFVDENAQVNKRRTRELLEISSLNYDYTRTKNCSDAISTPSVASAGPVGSKPPKAKKTSLAGKTTFTESDVVRLQPKSLNVPTIASSRIPGEAHTYILLRGVKRSGTSSIYEVELELSGGEILPIGVISFFGHEKAGHEHESQSVKAINISKFSGKLGPAAIPADTKIRIRPFSDGESTPSIASSSKNSLTIQKIELLVE